MLNFDDWEKKFEKQARISISFFDPAHDILHFKRVVRTAKQLAHEEKAKLEVVIPAAWLHDLVNVPKSDSRRKQASRLSAEAAVKFLKEVNYPEQHYNEIAHAIASHSFSAGIKAESLEAQIVQDADRLDGLGAMGIARVFTVATQFEERTFYSEIDPFCKTRQPDDNKATIDHFFVKLFKLKDTMNTKSGTSEAQRRTDIMRRYLEDLKLEI